MSAARRILERPWVIAGVAVGLAVVAFLNVWTFRAETHGRYAEIAESRSVDFGTNHLSYLMDVVSVEEGEGIQATASAEKFRWPRGARDPFDSELLGAATAVPERVETWRCDAVVLRGEDPIALVNGVPCRVGEKISGARVIAIDRLGVTLLKDRKEWKLAIAEDSPDSDISVVMIQADEGFETGFRPKGLSDHGGKR